ncbi:hypothetical protein HPB48_017257 [Haemaphysalis longicornis]|uniref:Uncharacterized protein n=1 Tax=Haemaphysalis longicornis TaxID=44386 RepID=A0A9J6GL49_HAELO|nr:hypothetical protein HPB48_017257 [Haemaphysalis longicornis]
MMNRTEASRNVKLFASAQTVEYIHVTLMSVLSIIDFLHSKGVNYIITASFKQGPLEVSLMKPEKQHAALMIDEMQITSGLVYDNLMQ